jgi:hypothetical protein
MAVTKKGIDYPTSSDNIAPLETWLSGLANGADKVGIVSGSQSFSGPTAADTPVTVTITFPTGVFTTAPKVIVAVEGSASATPYIANVYGTTTATTCVVKVNRISGTTGETLTLTWFASTYA